MTAPADNGSGPPTPWIRFGEVMVWIWEATREWTTSLWLCDPCADARRSQRWVMTRRRLAPPRAGTAQVMMPDGALACWASLGDRTRLTCLDCGANSDLGFG